MATRTTTTRTTTSALAPSADEALRRHADFSFAELLDAYYDCRENKRNTASALAFEERLEYNICELDEELRDGSYRPGRSVCFVVTRPKAREVWAADFRDRIVHHLLYNHVGRQIEAAFIVDSCACIAGRGTLYAARRLGAKVRSITENWSKPAWYLKLDLANFFVSIDKHILARQLAERIADPWWLTLAHTILFHDPRENFEFHGSPAEIDLVPLHKRLISQPPHLGLPIGNLSSQFFAGVYLDALDQFAKHQVRARHYIRYVDDFVLLHESPRWLNAALEQIAEFLPRRLHVKLNTRKTILQPIERGIDFVGHELKPWHRVTRRRTVREALRMTDATPDDAVFETANSYFGLFGQADHSQRDRAQLAKMMMRRGHCVAGALNKIYRRST